MSISLTSEPEECEIFGDFGWFIQGTLAFICFSLLICNYYPVKRYLEKNPRTWKVWFFDASKQGISSSILHCLNLLLSTSAGSDNQCTWYFLNFSVDTVLGMALCYLILHLLERCLQHFPKFSFKSGDYGEAGDTCAWIYQLWLWILIILVVKAIIWISMNIFQRPLQFLGEIILLPLNQHPHLELVMVMIFIPLVVNSLVFWITDSFLKNDKEIELDFDLELLPERGKAMSSLPIN